MNEGEIILYQTEDGESRVDVRMVDETVWLSLNQMAELFQRDKSTISRHISNVFAEGELSREAVVANFATTAADSKTYKVEHFNLDVIISVEYTPQAEGSKLFFATVQNKMHWAIHGHTAAEIIHQRPPPTRPRRLHLRRRSPT